MGAMTRAEYISQNLEVIRTLVRMGDISPKTMSDYKVYCFFCSINNKSVMQKYSITAEEMKMPEYAVARSVKRMKQKI